MGVAQPGQLVADALETSPGGSEVERVADRFGVVLHRRTIERVRGR